MCFFLTGFTFQFFIFSVFFFLRDLLTHTAMSVVESKLSKHCLVLFTAEDCARWWTGLLLSAGGRCQVSIGPLAVAG